jgi:hypothetical protein
MHNYPGVTRMFIYYQCVKWGQLVQYNPHLDYDEKVKDVINIMNLTSRSPMSKNGALGTIYILNHKEGPQNGWRFCQGTSEKRGDI